MFQPSEQLLLLDRTAEGAEVHDQLLVACPDLFLGSPRQQRLHLLYGLWDTLRRHGCPHTAEGGDDIEQIFNSHQLPVEAEALHKRISAVGTLDGHNRYAGQLDGLHIPLNGPHRHLKALGQLPCTDQIPVQEVDDNREQSIGFHTAIIPESAGPWVVEFNSGVIALREVRLQAARRAALLHICLVELSTSKVFGTDGEVI